MSELTSPPAALITGAAAGVGAAVAEKFVREGRRVLLADCTPAVHELAERLGPLAQAMVVQWDVEAEIVALAVHAREGFGGCGILVNSAGTQAKHQAQPTLTEEVSTVHWEKVMRINLTAPFLLCRELIPTMRMKGWGRVVNVASHAGRTYVQHSALAYSTSMAALIGITRQLGGENAACGVTVNCVAAGPLDTPAAPLDPSYSSEQARRKIPAARLGTTEELAAAVAFLASHDAAYITGACLDVNGGAFIG
jgi:3-oxoacyl-[acyl-carrier protein] reductase